MNYLVENGKKSGAKAVANGFFSSENQSRRRKDQLATEQRMSDEMVEDGYQIFSPTVVCDRIAVKDGKVFFVEFKKEGQLLRESQQLIHDLVPDNYIIKYDEV